MTQTAWPKRQWVTLASPAAQEQRTGLVRKCEARTSMDAEPCGESAVAWNYQNGLCYCKVHAALRGYQTA